MSFLASLSWAQLMTITVIILATGVILGIYVAHVMQRARATASRRPPVPGSEDAKGREDTAVKSGGDASGEDEKKRRGDDADEGDGEGDRDEGGERDERDERDEEGEEGEEDEGGEEGEEGEEGEGDEEKKE